VHVSAADVISNLVASSRCLASICWQEQYPCSRIYLQILGSCIRYIVRGLNWCSFSHPILHPGTRNQLSTQPKKISSCIRYVFIVTRYTE
jgi:hypothetical protein